MGNTPLDQPLPTGVSAADAVAELIELRRLSSRIETRTAELIEAIRVDDEADSHLPLPECDRPARTCDIHHLHPCAHGGGTNATSTSAPHARD